MFKPLHNYVLLERIEEENKTAGGIIIPDTARENRRVVVLSPRAMARLKTVRVSLCRSMWATRFCLQNGPHPRTRLKLTAAIMF